MSFIYLISPASPKLSIPNKSTPFKTLNFPLLNKITIFSPSSSPTINKFPVLHLFTVNHFYTPSIAKNFDLEKYLNDQLYTIQVTTFLLLPSC